MIRKKWLRLCEGFVSAFVLLLFSSFSLVQTARALNASSTAAQSTFQVAPSFSLSALPAAVATGDLRSSGTLDLVTADYATGTVTVYLGAGKGSYAAGVSYAVGSRPSAVTIADVNADGRLDILAANAGDGTLSVLEGNGDGTFHTAKSYSVGLAATFVATGNFSGSGRTDVVVGGAASTQLAVLLNQGNGVLAASTALTLTRTPTGIAAASLFGSSRTDLALANADGTVSILRSQGGGAFEKTVDIAVASTTLGGIVAADFNQDGVLDLAVAVPGQKLIALLTGSGNGSFAAAAEYKVGTAPVSLLVADLTGSGVKDLVAVNQGSNSFSILTGKGNGTFSDSADYISGASPVAAVAGDFYGSGHTGLAILNQSAQTVALPNAKGDGTFTAARSYQTSGQKPVAVATGALVTGSKYNALVAANYCGVESSCASAGTISVFTADSKGVYTLNNTYAVGNGPVSVLIADVNGDAIPDVVVLNSGDKTATVFTNDGTGSLSKLATFSLSATPVAAVTADLNADGNIDLAVIESGSSSSTVEVLAGAGNGSFQTLASYSVGSGAKSIAAGDLLGNGKTDLVVANSGSKTISVLLGDGAGKFTAGKDLTLSATPSAVALLKSGNTVSTLAVASASANTVSIYGNNGDGSFTAIGSKLVGNSPSALTVADFNGDGVADVAVANSDDSTVSVLYGSSNGSLSAGPVLSVGSGPVALAVLGSGKKFSLVTANAGSGSTTSTAASAKSTVTAMSSISAASASLGSEVTVVPNDVLGGGGATISFTLTTNSGLTATTLANDGTGSGDKTLILGVNDTVLNYNVSVTDETVTQSPAAVVFPVSSSSNDPASAVTTGDATSYLNALDSSLTVGCYTLNPGLAIPITGGSGSMTCTNSTQISNLTNFTSGVQYYVAAELYDYQGGMGSYDNNLTDLSYGVLLIYDGGQKYSPTLAVTSAYDVTTSTTTTSSSAGDSVRFTATLTGAPMTPQPPAGTIGFYVDGTSISGCTLQSVTVTASGTTNDKATATCTISSLTSGSHSITASYGGDTYFNTVAQSSSTPLTETVKQTPTAVTVSATSTPVALSSTSTSFTITVAGTVNGDVPTGSVSISGLPSGVTCTSSSFTWSGSAYIATCTTSAAIKAGTYSLTGTYTTGTSDYYTTYADTTNIYSYTVNKATPNVALVSGSPWYVNATGKNIVATFSNLVSGFTLTSGTVAFKTDSTALSDCSSVAISSNQATCSITTTGSTGIAAFSAGSHTLSVSVTDSNYSGGTVTSGASLTVNALSPTWAVTSSTSGASTVNQSVTYTAKLSGVAMSPIAPAGLVSITATNTSTNAVTPLCSGLSLSLTATGTTSDYGTAVCSSAALPAGTYTIKANYDTGGTDGNFTVGSAATVTQTVSAIASTLALSASSNTISLGTSETITATLTASSMSPVVPSGTVSFTSNGSAVSSCQNVSIAYVSSSWQASCTLSNLVAPADIIAASYTESSNNYTVSTNPSISISVGKATPTVTVTGLSSTSSSTTSVVNQPVTYTATVTAGSGTVTPTGNVTFKAGSTTLCSAASLSGSSATATASCTWAYNAVATPAITATYNGDQNYSSTSGTLASWGVTASGTATVVSVSNTSPKVNEAVTLSATITPTFATNSYTTVATPQSGTVSIYVDGSSTASCSLTVSNGSVSTCSHTFSTAASHTVSATFTSTDANFSGSTSASATVTTSAATTNLALTSGASSGVAANTSVLFTATLTSTPSGSTSPAGAVSFVDTTDSKTLCSSISVSGGTATCSYTFTTSKTHVITATFTPSDSNFSSATSSLNQLVNPQTTYVKATAQVGGVAVSTVGVNQSFSVVVKLYSDSSYASPLSATEGTVTIMYGTGYLCSSVAMTGGTATCSGVSVSAVNSSATLDISYSGGTDYSTASNTLSLDVEKSTVSLGLAASANPALPGNTIAFTTTVAPTTSGSAVPSGTVTYSAPNAISSTCTSAGTNLYTASVTSSGSNGVASCSFVYAISDYNGTETVSVSYSGDSNFSSLNSSGTTAGASVSEVIQNFSLSFTAPTSKAIYVTQNYNNGVTGASGVDVFNSTTITVAEATYGSFTDNLYPTCSITPVSGSSTSNDPTCSVTYASGVWSVKVTAPTNAPIGAYSLYVTAYDTSNSNLIHSTATPITVYVTSLGSPVFLAAGATGAVSVTFDTASTGTGTSLVSFSCANIWNLSTGALVTSGSVSCSASTTSSTSSATAVEVSMSLNSTTAMLAHPGTVSLATLAGIPLLILAGWLGGWRRQRKNFLRYMAILLLMVGFSYAVTGCGGSFTRTQTTTTSSLAKGSYLVQVVAKDSSSNKYYAVVPLTVNSNSVE